MSVLLSVPYDIDGTPHRVWMKALWMTRGDTKLARRLARLLDESVLPLVEEAEKTLGARVTARILLEKGITDLLTKVETKQLGRLPRIRARKKTFHAIETPVHTSPVETPVQKRGQWLGLCGSDQVTWTINGVKIPNEVIAEQVLKDAAKEGITPQSDRSDLDFPLVATGVSEQDGMDLAAYVRSHFRYCDRPAAIYSNTFAGTW
jgi:hypothetical protein